MKMIVQILLGVVVFSIVRNINTERRVRALETSNLNIIGALKAQNEITEYTTSILTNLLAERR